MMRSAVEFESAETVPVALELKSLACFDRFNTINELKDNDVFGAELYVGSYSDANLDMADNNLYTLDDNPYFKDPTHGDYTIVGENDFTYKFDFNAVGRK